MKAAYTIKEAKLLHDDADALRCVVQGEHEDKYREFQFSFTVAIKYANPNNTPDETKLLRFIIGHMDDLLDVANHHGMLSDRVADFD
jgi:hypothetical protein